MRNCDFGLPPCAIQSTRSSRPSIGVRSTWSRAMQGPGEKRSRPYTWRAAKRNATLTRLMRREAAVERLALFRHVEQELAGFEAVAMKLGELVAQRDKGLGAHAVDIGNGAAGERRKAEAQDRADVGFAHVGDDALLDAAGGFQRLHRQQPRFELADIDRIRIEFCRLQIGKP